MKSKQVIVIRKDLNMRRGKCVAQGCHASLKVIIDNNLNHDWLDEQTGDAKEMGVEAAFDWLNGSFTKICVVVNSEEELLKVYNEAKDKGLFCSLIQDAGLTEFGGVPTYTCCAVGPNWDDEIDPITKDLKLY